MDEAQRIRCGRRRRIPGHCVLRATLHTRLRARDRHTSSTLMFEAGPSSLHTTLEGPTEYVSECKKDVKPTWIPTWHRLESCFHGHLHYFEKPPLGGRLNTTPHRETMTLRTLTTVGLFYAYHA